MLFGKIKENSKITFPEFLETQSWKWRNEIISVSTKIKDFDLPDDELAAKYDGKRIYQYRLKYKAVAAVIPEPGNKSDKNALRVEVNGKMIGYIAKEDQPIARAVLKDKNKVFRPYLLGGNYKYVKDGYVEYNHEDISIRLYIEDVK